jgi:hypothetical protein
LYGNLIRNLEKIENNGRFGLEPGVEITVAISNVLLPVALTEIQHRGQLITRCKWLEKLCGRHA